MFSKIISGDAGRDGAWPGRFWWFRGWWPCPRSAVPSPGARTTTGSWATTAPPPRQCRWRWTPPGCWPARRSRAISAGRGHSCAVADGKAYCWGYNAPGQLGNNSTTNSGAGRGGRRAGCWPARPSPRSSPGRSTRVLWPTAWRTAGATTRTGGSATAAPPSRRCRSQWTPRGRWPARQSPRSPPDTGTRARWPTARRTAGATT